VPALAASLAAFEAGSWPWRWPTSEVKTIARNDRLTLGIGEKEQIFAALIDVEVIVTPSGCLVPACHCRHGEWIPI
jgi:hypothetical protein